MRPPRRILLHDAHGTGGAWPLLERQWKSDTHDFIVRAPEREMQEAERIEQRMGAMPESFEQNFLSDLRGTGAVRARGDFTDLGSVRFRVR